MPQAALPCAQQAEDVLFLHAVNLFQCRKRHYHVHNLTVMATKARSSSVSMPQAALPCAQRRYLLDRRSQEEFQCRKRHYHVHNDGNEKYSSQINISFNAASGITMCTTPFPAALDFPEARAKIWKTSALLGKMPNHLPSILLHFHGAKRRKAARSKPRDVWAKIGKPTPVRDDYEVFLVSYYSIQRLRLQVLRALKMRFSASSQLLRESRYEPGVNGTAFSLSARHAIQRLGVLCVKEALIK